MTARAGGCGCAVDDRPCPCDDYAAPAPPGTRPAAWNGPRYEYAVSDMGKQVSLTRVGQLLNARGAHGWELVGTVLVEHVMVRHYFRRPMRAPAVAPYR